MALAGCATKPAAPPKIETIIVPLPENIEALPEPPEPLPPELMTQSKAEDLWHLRAALNVAALICDHGAYPGLIPGYNRLLTTHKGLLAAAVQTELNQFKAKDGRKWQSMYDSHMTRLYNQYSLTQERGKFCERAAETAARAADLTPETLAVEATRMIFRLHLAGAIK